MAGRGLGSVQSPQCSQTTVWPTGQGRKDCPANVLSTVPGTAEDSETEAEDTPLLSGHVAKTVTEANRQTY